MSALTYQDHTFSPLQDDLLSTLRHQPEILRASLDGWLHSRKGEIDFASLQLLGREGTERGTITLAFQETQWLACQLETGCQPHTVRISFRIANGNLILSTLPREAFGDRQDEI